MLLVVVAFGLVACVSGTTSSAEPTQENDPNGVNPMRWITYSRQPMVDRQAAVERMLAEDAAVFWSNCAANTRQIDDWPMIRLLAEKARKSEDERALPWLVRSWAMPSVTVDDADRPERLAIEMILRDSARRVLTRIVFDPGSPQDAQTEVAAWSVLARIAPERWLRTHIDDAPSQGASVFVSMLKRFSPALDVLPADRAEVGQLLLLSVTHDDQAVVAWSSFRTSQDGEGSPSIALRHLPAIMHRDVTRDQWSREEWQGHVKKRLVGRAHLTRGDGARDDAVVNIRPERLEDNAHRLGIADLLVLDQLLDAMDDPIVVRDFFQQAEADRIDTTTEYGGALVWEDSGRLSYRPFSPLLRQHDQAYIASTPCMEATYLGLAHVHFHTQRFDNAAWAGPGMGDLDFADSQHVNCLVLTYIDKNTLNVDAYFPGRIVIDLGCVTR